MITWLRRKIEKMFEVLAYRRIEGLRGELITEQVLKLADEMEE